MILYESGVDPLVAMKIVGHSDYQTTANIYTPQRGSVAESDCEHGKSVQEQSGITDNREHPQTGLA